MMIDFFDFVDGYQCFYMFDWCCECECWDGLVKEQKLCVMVIVCLDSCVEFVQIFDMWFGEIFVVCNVVVLVLLCEFGGGYYGVLVVVEFVVMQLKVEEIVVLGYGSCGGCKVLLVGIFVEIVDGDEGYFIGDWVSLFDMVCDKVKVEYSDMISFEVYCVMEQEGVKILIVNLCIFLFVKVVEDVGVLKLCGVVFVIDDGLLMVLQDLGVFELVKLWM